MKSKKNKRLLIVLIIIGSIVTLAFILSVLLVLFKDKLLTQNSAFTYIGEFYEPLDESDYYYDDDDYEVLTSYNEYQNYFGSDNLPSIDFKANNYVVIPIRYDSCSESEITPTDYEITGNHLDITVKYKGSCGLCAQTYLYYLLKVDKNITYVNVYMNYIMTNNPHCDPYVVDKPIIYIYPEVKTNVTVKLGNPDYLTTTYPKYESGWNVTANPDGTLVDNKTGREHYGLYWEGTKQTIDVKEDGFVVEGENVASFLEEKLSILGLNEREANEFIIYWLPELEHNKYNYIRFETMEEINSYMPLEITPTPDTIIRIVMDYKPLDEKITVKEEKLEKAERKGYTVVEWGGSLIEN